MEVRGGCGYIEEWSDPRLVRDAHLGSIWEGTSNIVALDVIRAIKREGSLPVLQQYLHGCWLDPCCPPGARTAQALEMPRPRPTLPRPPRTAASAGPPGRHSLYNCTTAIAMAWEAAQPDKRAPAPVATGAAAPCAAARSAGRRRRAAPAG
jgi:hypothetical protein